MHVTYHAFERKSRKLEYLSSTLAEETVSLERKMLQRNNQEIAVAPTETAKLIKKITALKTKELSPLSLPALMAADTLLSLAVGDLC